MANDLQNNLNAILLNKNTNLLPENLRAGVTALGVTGTYEGGSSVEVPVKLFSTIEEMNADTSAEEGDLALVYGKSTLPIDETSEFQIIIAPNIVVLPTAVTSSVYTRFSPVNDSSDFQISCSLSATSFSFSCTDYTTGSRVQIRYTSSDGITYTRTDSLGNPVDIGVAIKCESNWNDFVGQFIQSDTDVFNGVFKYAEDKYSTRLLQPYNFNIVDNVLTNDYRQIDIEQLLIKINTLNSYEGVIRFIAIETDINGYPTKLLGDTNAALFYSGYVKYNDCIYACLGGTTSSGTSTATLRLYDFDTMTYSENSYDVIHVWDTTNSNYVKLVNIPIPDDDKLFTAAITLGSGGVYEKVDGVAMHIFAEGDAIQDFSNPLRYDNVYLNAPNQLNTTASEVYKTTFYGKNGVEEGTLNNNIGVTNAELKKRVDIYNALSELYITGDMSNGLSGYTGAKIPKISSDNTLTNLSQFFYNCDTLVDPDLSGLDTSNVTDMSAMFWGCGSITRLDLSSFDTSSVTKTDNMFRETSNLKVVIIDRQDVFNLTASVGYAFYVSGSPNVYVPENMIDAYKAHPIWGAPGFITATGESFADVRVKPLTELEGYTPRTE